MSERDIFIAARSKSDVTSRTAFLDAACAGDAIVRKRVERLLEADAEHDPLVDEPALAPPLDAAQTSANTLDSSLTMGVNPVRRDDQEWRHFLVPSDHADAFGRIGHYEVMEVLGSGGFGVVLRALDSKLNRTVALKMLAPQLAASVSSKHRFLREARSAAAIRHENVVQVYAVEEQPLPYMVMEFIPGETLQQRLDRVGPLPITDVVEIGRQIATGLSAAHATGLIHRDVKPANVFLGEAEGEPDGVSLRTVHSLGIRGLTPAGSPRAPSVKLLDFGLARAVDDVSLTQHGMILGTPLYMSPEQARGEPVDCRADLFSLGSVLYAMTTGRSPFQADNTLATLKRVSEEAPQPIDELAPETPRWLRRLVDKLLEKNPNERLQTAREVAELLAKPGEGDAEGIEATNSKRPRATLVAIALAAVVLLGAFLLSLRTPHGEVIVEVPDSLSVEERKQIKVEVSGDGNPRVVNDANGWTIDVKEGQYVVELRGGGDIVQIKDKQVTVTRGKQTIVRVTTKPVAAEPTNVAKTETQPASSKSGSHTWPTDAPHPALAPFDAAQARQHQAAWAKHLGVPVEYTNSVGMKFVLIPPGEFTMGSPPAEIEAHLKELSDIKSDAKYYHKQWQERIQSAAPQHTVVLTQAIYLGITEVTQQQYETVMGKNPAHFSPTGPGKEAVANLDTQNHPVEMVSWNDAAEFCVRLSESEKLKPCYFRVGDAVTPLAGNGYRLPTEAEWEFACRAGTTTKFWNGDSNEERIEVGWTSHNAGSRPHAVGELRANPFGLFDVHGNLFEWVEDAWDPQYYGQFSDKAAINPVLPNPGRRHCVIRGGSWGDPANFCRASTRHAYHPLDRFGGLGFRVSLPADAVNIRAKRDSEPTP